MAASALALTASSAPSAAVIKDKGLDINLEAIFQWVGLPKPAYVAFAKHMGIAFDSVVHPGGLAALPEEMFKEAVAKFEGDSASWRTKGLLFLAHRVCVHVCLAPLNQASADRLGPKESGEGSQTHRKVKMANVLDPIDESEIPVARQGQVDKCFANCKAMEHGPRWSK